MNLCFLIFVSLIIYINSEETFKLRTKQGILKGSIFKSRNGRPFYAFYGIPYAQPPLGELRFKEPVPPKPWDGVRDATVFPPICIHCDRGKLIGQEDCLHLNLFTPKVTNQTLLPVMVYTYGSRFLYGDTLPESYGPHYFMDKDVIVITYYYRLGALGFLSTEDEVIPGNNGLKDHIAVLHWVQKYIEDFGGDKNCVTIFGGSSGGITVGLTLISPLGKGLFHRAISQSGHPLDLEKPGKARKIAWKYASLVGCDDDNIKTSEELLRCLKEIPADVLANQNEKLYTLTPLTPALIWSPVIENEKVPGSFLIDDPKKLLQRKSDIPWITGMTSDDGGMVALYTYNPKSPAALNELEANYKKYFPMIFRYEYHVAHDQLDSVTETYKRHYFGEKNIGENIYGFSKMFTSLIYLTGLRELVRLYQGPKYVYYYAHKTKENFASIFLQYSDSRVDLGVIHGDELVTLFNWSYIISPVTDKVDVAVSEQMVELWTNFAIKGDPNNDDVLLWKPTESMNIEHLSIKNGTFEMKNELLKEECDFLDSVPVDGYF